MNATFKNSVPLQKLYRLSLLMTLILGFQSSICAEDLPLEYVISSKSAHISESMETITYLGKVKLEHERFLITGEKLTISYNEGKGTNISILGNPSSFTATPMKSRAKIFATAKEIIYVEPARLLVFKGNTVIERNGDKLEAASVNYNIATQEISARSHEGEDPVRLVIKSLK